ncbi:YdcF family protein [Bacillus thermotolerans]|uniref:YdcF family protein n=1 Tax=Bacillus thermotolerans TaxID=1221996 RepID=UPI000583A748|nr:YdcF family protein [Bacillus thermotolerans]KKB35451.1 hypothetical protein QY97_01629 [Bacillus thermotolerans]
MVTIILIILIPIARFFLVIDEEPKKADVIVVLSGDIGRLEKAAELYHNGYADQMMLSAATEAGTTPEEAIAFGVSEEDLILENEATSTYTNALYTKEKMEKYSFDSAIVVSSDYHMRRVKFIFDRVYQDSGVDLIYDASSRNDEAWYLDKRNVLLTAGEFMKLPAYWLGLYKFINL